MNDTSSSWRHRVLYFLFGATCLAGIFLLLGAASDHNNGPLSFGRYQLSSWATRIGEDSGVVGAFVIDTVTGETRTVYVRNYGNVPSNHIVVNDLKKHFNSVQ
jgi:hypothetical protein